MKNFIFGMSVGVTLGALAAFAAEIALMVVLEESPELLKTIQENRTT